MSFRVTLLVKNKTERKTKAHGYLRMQAKYLSTFVLVVPSTSGSNDTSSCHTETHSLCSVSLQSEFLGRDKETPTHSINVGGYAITQEFR